MIDLHYLATAINEQLGTEKYLVWVNTNGSPSAAENINVVTMSVARIPFAYTKEEIDAESLTITLTFDLPVASEGEYELTRDEALNDIHALLLGWRKFLVNVPTDDPDAPESYYVTVKFEQQAPSSPYVDSGRLTQQIVVSGTAWAQNASCMAAVGNDVVVSINGTPLLKVSRSATTQVGTDNNLPLSSGETLPEVYGISRASTKTLTFLYLGKDIEDEFLQIAEGAYFDVNKTYIYSVAYPSFTVSQKFILTGVSSQDSAGVYLQYTLTVQTVENATVTVNGS